MSDYHPDQWNPAWCVESILKGLVSFMVEGTATAGSMNTSTFEKQRLAAESAAHNLKNSTPKHELTALPLFKMVPTVLIRDVFLTVLGDKHVSNPVLKG